MDRSATSDASAPAIRGTWLDANAAERLHARAGAARWGLTVDRFHEALARVAARRFTTGAQPRDVETYLETLHLEDLALARGCADGVDSAWEAFVDRHWRDATRAARAIAGDAEGDEIADALLADLFARGDGPGVRRPLFDYFHGRSRLGTWLRALLAQRHVDRVRATRRLTPLDDDAAEARPASGSSLDDDPARAGHVERALDRALAALPPRDRLRLACYHADDMTLAAVGRLLGEHEATVSRKLQKTRDQLKAAVDAVLADELRLTAEERRDWYAQAIEAGTFDVERLRGPDGGPGPPAQATGRGPAHPPASRATPGAGKKPAPERSRKRDDTP